jgi:superfamily II DNA/RNA helicase
MIDLYFSLPGWASVPTSPLRVDEGKVPEIVAALEARYVGLRGLGQALFDSAGNVRAEASLWAAISVSADGRLLEGPNTRRLTSARCKIVKQDGPLLLCVFQPAKVLQFLTETLSRDPGKPADIWEHAEGQARFACHITHPSYSRDGQPLFAAAEEPIYGFTLGRPLDELIAFGSLDPIAGKLLPQALRGAVERILGKPWGSTPTRLRMFQEEMLCRMLSELARPATEPRQPLILTVPTGGGKTEAFFFALAAHITDERQRESASCLPPSLGTRAMLVYPTRALASDQARRISQILYEINSGRPFNEQITVGMLTGDTPSSSEHLTADQSPLQVCPRCEATLARFERISMKPDAPLGARCRCGAVIEFFRLSRADIVAHPPDVLVLSPDMMNRMLQSPRYNRLFFTSRLRVMVWDEIHVYSGVFGCHVAHLLRRVEEACGIKPLYVGVSATIRNARQLACALFNEAPSNVCYLRPQMLGEAESDECRAYLDYKSGPVRVRHHVALCPARFTSGRFANVTTATLNLVSALCHAVPDPHTRKTLVFCNFRQNTDDMVRLLIDHEERYFAVFARELWPHWQVTQKDVRRDFSAPHRAIISTIGRWFEQAARNSSLHTAALEIGWHRGGLERAERLRAVNRFAVSRRLNSLGGETPWPIDVMVATSSLELGVDIGDVTTVIHCGAPRSIHEYVQRVGRGARRGSGLAITMIDSTNPLDFHFLRHFAHFANPSPADLEEVPMAISNPQVARTHMLARLVDYLAQSGGNNSSEVVVGDLRALCAQVAPGSNLEQCAERLWEEIIGNGSLLRLEEWLAKEAVLVPGACAQVWSEIWREEWQEAVKELLTACDSAQSDQMLSGRKPLSRAFVPALRDIGSEVTLHLAGNDDAPPQDTVSRHMAINNCAPGAHITQGRGSFRVTKIRKADTEAMGRWRRALMRRGASSEKATAYFHNLFHSETTPFPDTPIELIVDTIARVPAELEIIPSPARFHCAACGATYSDGSDGQCPQCESSLRQLTELYICGGCGELFMPPVPKVCLNPECIVQARDSQGRMFANRDYLNVGRRHDAHNAYFRFDALPFLHWQCRACGTSVNFHARHGLPSIVRHLSDVPNIVKGQRPTSAQIARFFLYKPEGLLPDYDEAGFHRSHFYCQECRKKGTYNKIHVVNVPSARTLLNEYILPVTSLVDDWNSPAVAARLMQVEVLGMGRERARRYHSYAQRESCISVEPIFEDNNEFLANVSSTHGLFLRLREQLDQFVLLDRAVLCHANPEVCACNLVYSTESIGDDESTVTLPVDTNTRPLPSLVAWEKGQRPDPRRHWCDVVLGIVPQAVCPGDKCVGCEYFDERSFKRYLILHTLKHALLAAAPRYSGAQRGQLRGILNPNDEKEWDLVILDTSEGGSGSLWLLREHWDATWALVGELLEAALKDRGGLLLAHGCARFNRDLCPSLALKFFHSVPWQETKG